ncbi:hypothetical protein [Gemmobacter sp. 24YEA27]|uniref:hypothetical protein n=1 Tax=Gemmobacter sp. 24YEA27 TaxID=3040672 RepID=UPI0024B3BF04|nr:hypothetical protein [Gemmobacter sp. 24YEA27]
MPDTKTLDAFFAHNGALLQKIMDTLIPADPERAMPSASKAGVLDRHLRAALLRRDDLAPGFVLAVGRAAELAPVDLDGLLTLSDTDFGLISRVIAGAYFMNAEVNERLGYRGQSEMRETVDYDEIISLIEGPVGRGDVYTHI